MLTVQDIAAMPALELEVVAGASGLTNEIRWLHASEHADPTPWMSGGELLLATGPRLVDSAEEQRAYVRRLAKHRLAGLGFGLGFGFDTVPEAIVETAEELGFPVLAVPYEVPFIAISKAVFTHCEPHCVSPTWQTHAPFWHVDVAKVPGQTLPHVPQLLRSVWRLRHWLPHSERPSEQTQLPLLHTRLAPQVLPHEPQLVRSV